MFFLPVLMALPFKAKLIGGGILLLVALFLFGQYRGALIEKGRIEGRIEMSEEVEERIEAAREEERAALEVERSQVSLEREELAVLRDQFDEDRRRITSTIDERLSNIDDQFSQRIQAAGVADGDVPDAYRAQLARLDAIVAGHGASDDRGSPEGTALPD